MRFRFIALLICLGLLPGLAAAQQLSPADLSLANAFAAQLAGVSKLSDSELAQTDLGGDQWGYFDPSSTPSMSIDTTQIQRDLGTSEEDAIMACVVMTLWHEYMHREGYGQTGGGEWWNEPWSQTACEHIGIYLAGITEACELAEYAGAQGYSGAAAALCLLVQSDAGLFNGDFAPLLLSCRAEQATTPQGYIPPTTDLGMPDSIPECEICE